MTPFQEQRRLAMAPDVPESDPVEGPRVVAVVLHWNGGDETRACLASLRALEAPRPLLVLADNGSSDDVVAVERAADPDLHVLELGSNLGYAAGNNRAMEYAFGALRADWVVLLNSDLVVTPSLFGRLLAAAARPSPTPLGALGPCLLYRDRPDVIWALGGRIGPTLNVTRLLGHGRAHVPAESRTGPADPVAVDYLPGTCLMIGRAAWESVGGFDEAFFCYLEDADWCVRVRQAGFGVRLVPDALAYHGLSSSTGGGYSAGRKYMTAVNSVRFLRKHGGFGGWAALVVFDLMLWPLALVRGLVRGQATAAAAKLRGVLDGLRGVRVDASVAARYARRRP